MRVTGEQRTRSSSKARAKDVAPPIDRSTIVPEMPPETLYVKTGFNCVVILKIAGVPFRVILDSGAARSIIRTRFAEQLRKNKKTRAAAYGPRPLDRPVTLEGCQRVELQAHERHSSLSGRYGCDGRDGGGS